jgi:hypothetical protein
VRKAVLVSLGVMLVLIAVSAALGRRNRVRTFADEERTLESVLHHVPVGSGVGSALFEMERSGFRCSIQRGVVQPDSSITSLLNCAKDRPTWWLIAEHNWRVAFYLGGVGDSIIRDVRVGYSQTAF